MERLSSHLLEFSHSEAIHSAQLLLGQLGGFWLLFLEQDIFFFFWPRCAACGILVPQPGIEPVPPAVEVWSPDHWTTREVPEQSSLVSRILRCESDRPAYPETKATKGPLPCKSSLWSLAGCISATRPQSPCFPNRRAWASPVRHHCCHHRCPCAPPQSPSSWGPQSSPVCQVSLAPSPSPSSRHQ